MSDDSLSAPPAEPSAKLPRRYFIYPLLVALASGVVYLKLSGSPFIAPDTSSTAAADAGAVQPGKDYYVTVALLEISERDAAGGSWDSLTESGPDIYVEIQWKGTRIYRSTVKKDTFVAKWSNAELNLRALALSGQGASMDDIIHAARMNVKPDEEIVIRAFDDDLLSGAEAGSLTVKTTDLRVGDTTYELAGPGIKRLVIRVSDMSQAVDPLS